jgi:CheY-like chemotaxis protein
MQRRRKEESDHVLLLVDPDDAHRDVILPHLEAAPARDRFSGGGHPRFRVVVATNGDEALARAGAEVTVAAVDLVLPRVSGLDVIQSLRSSSPDVAVLAFTTVAPPSEAVAAVMTGADYFLEWRDDTPPDAFERALDVAIERRRLTRLIDRKQTDIARARGRLAELSGELDPAASQFGRPYSRDDVLPFREAARRYLAASARLFEGDAQGLARSLGVSYFALRRLLARYAVPFPRRARGTPRGGR